MPPIKKTDPPPRADGKCRWCQKAPCFCCHDCGADMLSEWHKPGCPDDPGRPTCVPCLGTGLTRTGKTCPACLGACVNKKIGRWRPE